MSNFETAQEITSNIQKNLKKTMLGGYIFSFQGKCYRVSKDADRPAHSRWLCQEHNAVMFASVGARVYSNYSYGRTRSEAIQTIIYSELEY